MLTFRLVVLLKSGPYAGKTATIVEIIDQNRVYSISQTGSSLLTLPSSQALIDGPTTGVPRQPFPYKHLVLTNFVVKDLPRGAGPTTLKKYIEKSDVESKWEATAWAKKRAVVQRRKALSDFERFKLMIKKRSRRDKVRKTLCKA